MQWQSMLCGLALLTPVMSAAQGRLALDLKTGTYVPTLDLVEFAGTATPNVELRPGSAVGAEITLGLSGPLRLYGGLHWAFSQLEHTTALETESPAQPASDVDLVLVTGGITLSPPLFDHIRPRLLLGAGLKRYTFDLAETGNPGWFTLDYGLGFTVAPAGSWSEGNVLLTAEFRQYASTFDPATLPLAAPVTGGQRQFDTLFLLGIQVRLGRKP